MKNGPLPVRSGAPARPKPASQGLIGSGPKGKQAFATSLAVLGMPIGNHVRDHAKSPATAWTGGILLLCAAVAVSAHPRSPVEPGSAATISISVSVAPHYKLRREGGDERFSTGRGPDPFCIASNGPRSSLPIMLIWSPAEVEILSSRGASSDIPGATAARLEACDASPAIRAAGRSPGTAAVTWAVIVRPE